MPVSARPAQTGVPSELRFGRFTLQPGRQLLVDGVAVAIGRKALGILTVLVEARGDLVTKDALLDAVWPGTLVEENTLQSHISALRRVLGSEATWITTVAGQGYRYSGPPPEVPGPNSRSAPVQFPEDEPRRAEPMPPSHSSGARRPARRHARTIAVGLAVLIVAALGWHFWRSTPSRAVEIQRYLVLPFTNRTGDPDRDAFADALTDAVSGRIAAETWDSRVVGHREAFAYKGRSVDEAKLADELGLTYIVEGNLPPSQAGVEAMLRIIDARTGTQVAVVNAKSPRSDAETERRTLVAGLIDQLLISIFRYEKHLIEAGKVDDSDIRNLLLRAETPWGEPSLEDQRESTALIGKALALDPHNVHALTLAAAMRVRAVAAYAFDGEAERTRLLEGAESDLQTAVRLEPTRPIIHLLMGDLRSAWGQHDAARAEYERALEIDPTSTYALTRLALEDIYQEKIGPAQLRLERARKLNPDDSYFLDSLAGLIAFMSGRDEEALASMRRAIATDAVEPWGWPYLAGLAMLTNAPDEAKLAVASLRKMSPRITIAKMRLDDANTGPAYRTARERLYAALEQAGLDAGTPAR